jgi:hypothetical protein
LESGNASTTQTNILLFKTNYVPALYSANALAITTGLVGELENNVFANDSYQRLISDGAKGIIEKYND